MSLSLQAIGELKPHFVESPFESRRFKRVAKCRWLLPHFTYLLLFACSTGKPCGVVQRCRVSKIWPWIQDWQKPKLYAKVQKPMGFMVHGISVLDSRVWNIWIRILMRTLCYHAFKRAWIGLLPGATVK